jgi:PAS domain-containing protein
MTNFTATGNYTKLLERQVNKFIPKDLQNNPDILNFLNSVNSSYNSFEKDITLTNHAFSLSEIEYIEINKKLKLELDIKNKSIHRLKETVNLIEENEQVNYSGDLLEIVDYLNQQVNKRKESENFLSAIIENLHKGLLLQNDEGKILYINQSFCNIFNIKTSPSDLKSNDCSKCSGCTYYCIGDIKSSFSDVEAFVAAINTIEQKRQIELNKIIEFKDGRTFERSYVPIFIDEEFHGHFWTYHDITELQRANEKIRNNVELLTQCQRIAKLGICEINFNTNKTYWSDEFFIARGLAAQEIEPDFNLFLQSVHPDDREKFVNENGEKKKYLDHPNIIYRIIKPDGSIRVMHDISETVYDKFNKPIRISHISRDITEQTNNEQEIVNQRKFTEDILNSLPVDIAVFDLQHNYIFLNPKAIGNEETRKWLIGKNDFDYCQHKNVNDAMAKKRRVYFNNAIKNNGSEEWIDEHVRKDGESDFILRRFFPYTQNNAMKFVIGYGVYISKLKKAEATINLAMEMKEKPIAIWNNLPLLFLTTCRSH